MPEFPTVKEAWLYKKAFSRAIKGPSSAHDLHITVLHLLGIDHTKLPYRFGVRDFLLTDVMGT